MFNLNLKEGTYPIIILPNLGQPILINLKDFKQIDGNFSKIILFDAIIITLPEQTIQDILYYFHENLYIQVVLKGDGDFKERRGQKFLLQITEIKKVGVLQEHHTNPFPDFILT